MNERHTVHIVGGNSRYRAEQAHLIYSLGLHSEIYANVAELMERPPQSGIVLAYDDPEGESAAHVLKALSDFRRPAGMLDLVDQTECWTLVVYYTPLAPTFGIHPWHPP